jgi:hypothetical protein
MPRPCARRGVLVEAPQQVDHVVVLCGLLRRGWRRLRLRLRLRQRQLLRCRRLWLRCVRLRLCRESLPTASLLQTQGYAGVTVSSTLTAN